MVGSIADLPTEVLLPEGVRIEPVTDAAGVKMMTSVHDDAFERPSPRIEQQLLRQVAEDPDSLIALVVMAGDRPVCASRLETPSGN